MLQFNQNAIDKVRSSLGQDFDLFITLGSGLGTFPENMKNLKEIPYSELPGFPQPSVKGHKGTFCAGYVSGLKVIAARGRFHYYEGFTAGELLQPLLTASALLKKPNVLLTNAAGALNPSFKPGDLAIITDQVNFMGFNPLRGPVNEQIGPRFPDMTTIYEKKAVNLIEKAAAKAGVNIQKGIYLGVAGPSYETPAEIRIYRQLGADMVGMSTVPEAITAKSMGLRVSGISLITNMGAGYLPEPLDHAEVIEIGRQTADRFCRIVTNYCTELAEENV